MIEIKLDKAKQLFFDRQMVVGAMDKATHAALARGGAIIMREARRSIKPGTVMARGRVKAGERRKVASVRVSAPGNPPYSQTGLLRDNIFFIATPGRFGGASVKIGPILIGRPTGAPDNLEFGATLTMRPRPSRHAAHHAARPESAPRTIRIEARPYMRPALEKLVASGRLPDMWRNALPPGGGPRNGGGS
jgi:hypothetical protein